MTTQLSASDEGGRPRAVPVDATAAQQARDLWAHLTLPAGDLGRLEDLGAWLCAVHGQCPPRPVHQPVVLVIAADHGIVPTSRTSAFPPGSTRTMMEMLCRGESALSALARQAGVRLRLVDAGVDAEVDYLDDYDPRIAHRRIRRGTGSIDIEDAMTRAQAAESVDLGRALVDEEVDSGADLIIIGHAGTGATTSAAAIVGLLTSRDAVSVTGRASGIDDATWMRKVTAVRDAIHRGRDSRGDMLEVLTRIGGIDVAVITGVLLQAAARRTPVIVDGLVATAAGIVADRMDFRARQWWLAGHRSHEPGHRVALDHLDLLVALDMEITAGDGTAALLAFPVVQSSIAVMLQTPTRQEAGLLTQSCE